MARKKSESEQEASDSLEELSALFSQKLDEIPLTEIVKPVRKVPRPERMKTKAQVKGNAYHHGDLYEALLTATLEQIVKHGVQGISLRGIAQQVGVSAAAPYRHFADKQEMIAAVATRGFEMMASEMQALDLSQTQELSHPLEALRQLARIYFQFAYQYPTYFDLMFGSAIENKELYPELKTASEKTFLNFISAISAAHHKGQLKPFPPEQIALAFWAQLHGYANLMVHQQIHWKNLGADSPEALLETLLKMLFQGLLQSPDTQAD
ncbi:hypothetical protein COW36_08320 [bacterium (Candidatus Blackallbacteria) CG17_big_fil_post_rev_8_21_14_2_50_48_46]|uniref:HTH tetR-type domain-containing protein n=1 Tax=bacterium (Candidatus Blackallbacteria) CG17_big_fil_post_rev_8_21_14_2_50_48_46 TaxID=2014261 RepID=A0A2M7G681_9BACT|nr:MAG: hypothetical protein COW64_24860 [bacterium (Candidatus Blackallbacteria) CG18_big_fil_WC_8_21_14_2_50_49_26]PIW17495.1 MAG: hypothetical protein COW36_08320 [bacterium (Candidatus Blackallbacteria) CG17_big_fil_post_rev_8_21_14_2_50_48_46]PIW48349.1 MAG: hypothetical protein COW20_09675 [bacterium (Candidatus Blackallbacteria) CG13_big_fil_rev_8_21_14_2_50_49_14]